MPSPFAPLSKVLEIFSAGKFIIVLDEHRECEADFFMLAEYVTPENINFLLTHARGMICVACDKSVPARLHIPLMVQKNGSAHGTNFCVSVDAAKGITTGISASDRAKTIALLANPKSKPEDLVLPGHTFPLIAKSPAERFGHTESAVELAKKVKKTPVVVICEILNKQGGKATKTELIRLSKKLNCPFTSLEILRESLIS